MKLLFEKALPKTEVIKKISETLKNEKLTCNFSNKNWVILEKNHPTKILNVEIHFENEKKYLSILYSSTDKNEQRKQNFLCFDANPKNALDNWFNGKYQKLFLEDK